MSTVLRLQHVSVPMPSDGAERARAFYGGVIGLQEKQPPSTLTHQKLVWFSAGDGDQEVHVFEDDTLGRNSSEQHLCLQVDDIDALRAQLESAGVEIEEATPINNRPRLFVRDPFRNLIELTQIRGEYD
jgi:catechol 2,3-dioxygenase-like lactoylglutathione lyase family enzyme